MKGKIYISGKVTGLPADEVAAKFTETEKQLIAAGCQKENIMNPVRFGIDATADWHEAMHICIENLRQCTAIYIQRDWRDSFGARKEITLAASLKMQMYWEEQGDLKLVSEFFTPVCINSPLKKQSIKKKR